MDLARPIGAAGVWASLALVGTLAGCGSGTEPTPVAPSLVGEYAGTWTQDVRLDGQPAGTLACTCTLTIPTQAEGVFFGRSTLSSPCDQGLLTSAPRSILSISDGRIEASGAVTFRFSEDPPVGISGGGCTVTTMDAFTGTYAGGTLTASRNEAYDCTAGGSGRIALTTRLVATRR
jgi:hypothetical protein